VLTLTPPLIIITAAEMDAALAILEESIAAVGATLPGLSLTTK